jgi:hypothetical protein
MLGIILPAAQWPLTLTSPTVFSLKWCASGNTSGCHHISSCSLSLAMSPCRPPECCTHEIYDPLLMSSHQPTLKREILFAPLAADENKLNLCWNLTPCSHLSYENVCSPCERCISFPKRFFFLPRKTMELPDDSVTTAELLRHQRMKNWLRLGN